MRQRNFYSLNVAVAIPNPLTGTLVGWNGNITMDRNYTFYISPYGGTIGKSATLASGSLTVNWLNQTMKPTSGELNSFLSGQAISVSAGYYLGGNVTISPTNPGTKTAIGGGIFTPQAGVSYNYTPDNLIFNK